MTTARRRVIRPSIVNASHEPRRRIRRERQQAQLAKDQVALKRWLTRLKRAVTILGRLQRRIDRLSSVLGQQHAG
jgi:hypothetical protein